MSKETINIDVKKKSFKAKLIGVEFKEGNSQIIYLPSLQLSSYGDTLEEAKEMMEKSLKEFSMNLLQQGEHKILSILNDYGWVKTKFFNKRLTHLSDITFEDIKKEFNLPENTQVEKIPLTV